MTDHLDEDTESRAAIFRHPLHPMLIPFPIAFLVGTLVTDLAFRSTGNAFWAEASYWLLIAGIATGLVAALPGLVDYLSIRRARRLASAHVHALGNVTALALAAANLWLRWDNHALAGTGSALLLSLLVVALLGVTGWIGGELSYRHRIGVMRRADEGGSHASVLASGRARGTASADAGLR